MSEPVPLKTTQLLAHCPDLSDAIDAAKSLKTNKRRKMAVVDTAFQGECCFMLDGVLICASLGIAKRHLARPKVQEDAA